MGGGDPIAWAEPGSLTPHVMESSLLSWNAYSRLLDEWGINSCWVEPLFSHLFVTTTGVVTGTGSISWYLDWSQEIILLNIQNGGGLVVNSPLTLFDPMDCSPPVSSVRGIFPGKNIVVGCHFLLQGIFLIQGLNPGLLHCRQILYQLSYPGIRGSLIYLH